MAIQPYSNSDWQNFFKKLGSRIQILERIEALRDNASLLRSKTTEEYDKNNNLSAYDLGNQAVIGTNTDNNGFLYINVTSASPNIVQVYKDSGLSNLVASGTGALGATITLNEKNASGFTTFKVTLASSITSDNTMRIRITNDMQLLLNNVYGAGIVAEDVSKIRIKASVLDDLASTLQSQVNSRKSNFDSDFLSDFLPSFLNMSASRIAEDILTYTLTNSAGNITLTRTQGILQQFNIDLVDNTQTVKKNTVTNGSLTAAPQNIGQMSLSNIVLKEHALSGTLNFRCTEESFPSEQITISHKLTNILPNGSDSIASANLAQIARTLEDAVIGFKALFNRVITDTGDPNNVFSTYVISGESTTNTNNGLLYAKLSASPTPATFKWLLEVFKNSDLASANLVDNANIASGTGTVAVTLTAQNGSGLNMTLDFNKTNANGASLPYQATVINLNRLRLDDSWTMTITNDEAGLFQIFLARYYGFSINSAVSPTILDAMAQRMPVTAAKY